MPVKLFYALRLSVKLLGGYSAIKLLKSARVYNVSHALAVTNFKYC